MADWKQRLIEETQRLHDQILGEPDEVKSELGDIQARFAKNELVVDDDVWPVITKSLDLVIAAGHSIDNRSQMLGEALGVTSKVRSLTDTQTTASVLHSWIEMLIAAVNSDPYGVGKAVYATAERHAEASVHVFSPAFFHGDYRTIVTRASSELRRTNRLYMSLVAGNKSRKLRTVPTFLYRILLLSPANYVMAFIDASHADEMIEAGRHRRPSGYTRRQGAFYAERMKKFDLQAARSGWSMDKSEQQKEAINWDQVKRLRSIHNNHLLTMRQECKAVRRELNAMSPDQLQIPSK